MEEKWRDADDETLVQSDCALSAHKKIARKAQRLRAGLVDAFEKSNGGRSVAWAAGQTRRNPSATQRLLLSAANMHVAEPTQWTVKKRFQTDPADALRSVVRTIDAVDELVAYAGLDKVLHIARLDAQRLKRYQTVKTIYTEKLPIVESRFVDSNRLIARFERKNFIGLIDVDSEKLTALHKLTRYGDELNGIALQPNKRLALAFSAREGCLVDTRTEIFAAKATYAQPARAGTFLEEHTYAIAGGDANVRLFDIRKDLATPLQLFAGDYTRIAGSGERLVCGGRGGAVRLFNWKQQSLLLKEFRQLTTDIGNVAINGEYMAMATPWKRNGVRLVDLSTLKVLALWPNIKTNLGTVKSLCLGDKNHLIVGNSLGHVHFYDIFSE